MTKHYPPDLGGIESVTYDLAEGINKAGCCCDILCCSSTHYTLKSISENGYKIYRAARIAKLASTSISWDLIRLLKKVRNDYDIIHVHFPDPMSLLALYLIRPSCKIIVHWHSDIIKQKYLYKVIKPLESWLLKRADAIIATSPAYIPASKALMKFRNKVAVIPIGIPVEAVNGKKQDELLKCLNGRSMIFALGRHVYYKGFEVLIRAAEYLDESYCIVIGGNGPLTPRYQKLIVDLRLQHKVKLAGKIPSDLLSSYYNSAKVFCLPSTHRSEAYGVVLLEAMKHGLPVVATEIVGSGVSWVNEEGTSGYNVPIQNSEALAKKIKEITQDQELSKLLSYKAKERFLNLFTADVMVNSVVELYKKVTMSV